MYYHNTQPTGEDTPEQCSLVTPPAIDSVTVTIELNYDYTDSVKAALLDGTLSVEGIEDWVRDSLMDDVIENNIESIVDKAGIKVTTT